MTKADLVDLIYKNGAISQRVEAVDVIECLLETLKTTLAEGEVVKIAGFGRFEVNEKSARRGRNPQTGEEITIEKRKVLTFKPSTILKARLNVEGAN
jgi:integration host factor subunit alpha